MSGHTPWAQIKRHGNGNQCTTLHERGFADVSAAYQANAHSFYAAWHFLHTHPIVADGDDYSRLTEALSIHVAKVEPTTGEIGDDATRTTQTEVWLELGPTYLRCDAPAEFRQLLDESGSSILFTHDPELDCGSESFEEAIINLARLVWERYGLSREHVYQ